jgi:ATP-dependent RNA helicase DeaD
MQSQAADEQIPPTFADLGLSEPIVAALREVGYESPSPIQAATIPVLLGGHDLIGQAQTGTGKTAAFALPFLSMLDVTRREPQVLVMVPTRELAIQVAEAFQKYASKLPGLHVLPIYGGQSYVPQLNALKRGTHVIVATPGRVIDHLQRGTLNLATIRYVVLDEADEMLQMGFVDAIDEILAMAPPERQVALFSATLPKPIRNIAQKHLRSPQEVTIRSKTTTATNIRQRYWVVSGMHKLDALTRILEVETFDAMLVFARTKQATVELVEKLEARGFASAALNGDILQAQRERTVAALKAGKIDIVVATDVAARGLDVDRITHVVNFDVPYDSESYVHRIGRTGRAGRSGEAILFIAPRERNMLRIIERATRQPIEAMSLPTLEDVNAKRATKFKQEISAALTSQAGDAYRGVLEDFLRETDADLLDVAAALAAMVRGGKSLAVAKRRDAKGDTDASRPDESSAPPRERDDDSRRKPARPRKSDTPQATFRLEVGRKHGVLPGNIVGALAHEGDLHGTEINGLSIRDDHTLVRLPAEITEKTLAHLRTVEVRGRPLAISRYKGRKGADDRDG